MLRILPLAEAQSFITRKTVRLAEAEQVVAPILDAVRSRGDEAVPARHRGRVAAARGGRAFADTQRISDDA